MCRNIRQLYNFEPRATDEEVRAAALQYVRKISGFTKPSQVNAEAFERAIDEVAHASMHLLDALQTSAPPKDREVEAAKARARSAARALAFAASTSRSFGGADVTNRSSSPADTRVTSSTASSNASAFACDGLVKPLILRTYWSEAARISSSVARGS